LAASIAETRQPLKILPGGSRKTGRAGLRRRFEISHFTSRFTSISLKGTRRTPVWREVISLRSIIQQSVVLSAPAHALYAMYLDRLTHAAITGAPVTISAEPGAAFLAFEGAISGTILSTISPSLIVQSWRSVHFHEDDADSTLILSFRARGEEGQIDLVHLDVPAHDFAGVTDGWETHYWGPWRRYLTDLRVSTT
jgi:activator of HSP90 ATPase